MSKVEKNIEKNKERVQGFAPEQPLHLTYG